MNNSTTAMVDTDDSLAKLLQDFTKQCNVQNYSWDKNLLTSAFLAIFLAGFCCQIVTFPATWRIGSKRPAFFIILNSNVGHSIELLGYIGICLEYFLVGHSIHYLLGLDGYLHSLMYSLIPFCYVTLALNRFVSIFMPLEYDKIFNSRSIKVWIGACWLLGLLYSVGMNSRPELRPYHCIDQLVIVSLISKGDLAHQSTYVVTIWTGNQFLTIFFAIMPMILYFAVFAKMVIDQFLRKASSDSSAPAHDHNRERTRLFMISLLSTLPYFLMFLVSKMQLLIGDPELASWVSILYKSLFILFQLHQPFLMYWLSMEFRREVIRDLQGILPRLFKKNGQHSLNIHSKTIPTKQAWK